MSNNGDYNGSDNGNKKAFIVKAVKRKLEN